MINWFVSPVRERRYVADDSVEKERNFLRRLVETIRKKIARDDGESMVDENRDYLGLRIMIMSIESDKERGIVCREHPIYMGGVRVQT